MQLARKLLAAFAIGAAIGAPLAIASAANTDHREFGGTLVHVSSDNIKVHGIEGGKSQTLSFLIDPKLTKLTHVHGKTTAELRDFHVGDQVRVMFDQRFLGIRHADSVTDLTDTDHMKT